MREPKTNERPALRQAKVQFRLSTEQKEAITRAARLRQTTLSNFIRENAYSAAQQVLAEQVHFALPPTAGKRSAPRWTPRLGTFPHCGNC